LIAPLKGENMHREKMIILAGQYLLGHLSEQDAAEAERRMRSDPESTAQSSFLASPLKRHRTFGGGLSGS
jgi:hypothetical protein